MIGKKTKYNLLSFIHEFSYFSGKSKDILEFIKNNIKLLYIKKDLMFFSSPTTNSNKDFHNWLLSLDSCIQLLNFDDIPKSAQDFFSKPNTYNFIIPIRNILYSNDFLGFFATNLKATEIINLLQILASQISHKIHFSNIHKNMSTFMKYHYYGKVSSEIFHEIKNKLIAPQTFLQTFEKKQNDEHFKKEFSKIAASEINTIQDYINNFLNYGKYLNNKSKTNLNFNKTLEKTLSLLKFQLLKYNITIINKVDPDFDIPVTKDIKRDILLNLLLNAIQAIKPVNKKTKKIEIKSIHNKKFYSFSIKDNGCGISKENIKNIFDEFFTTKSKGTGLGLHIIKKFIESYNGKILVTSEINKGTKFTITFPC